MPRGFNLDWTVPQYCVSCPKKLVPNKKGLKIGDLDPGTSIHSGHGRCYNCARGVREGYTPRPIIVYDETKGLECKDCKETLPLDDFDTYPYDKAKYRPSCRMCSKLKQYYHITKEYYIQLLESQNNCCAICERDASEIPGGLHIDHDHACCPSKARSCGKCVRGLLCSRCNKGIGLLMDDKTILTSAIKYLENQISKEPIVGESNH